LSTTQMFVCHSCVLVQRLNTHMQLIVNSSKVIQFDITMSHLASHEMNVYTAAGFHTVRLPTGITQSRHRAQPMAECLHPVQRLDNVVAMTTATINARTAGTSITRWAWLRQSHGAAVCDAPCHR